MEESDKELFMESLKKVSQNIYQTDLDSMIGFLDPSADPDVEGSGESYTGHTSPDVFWKLSRY